MPLKRPSLIPAPSVVLGLLCLMYFITYVNRQNMATAGGDIIRDLHLTRGQLGKVIGAFGVTTRSSDRGRMAGRSLGRTAHAVRVRPRLGVGRVDGSGRRPHVFISGPSAAGSR
jgi:hypothetical protein